MIALCLPGGGAAGANQAGMLSALSETVQLGDIDVVVGASVGSLNGALFLCDPPALESVWTNIKKRHVYWPVPTLWSTVWNKPLRKLVREKVSVGVLRGRSTELLVQATDYNTSQPKTFNQWHPQFHQALLASSAIPVVFPAVKLEKTWYVDGGVSDNTPLLPVVQSFIDSKATHLELVMLHCDPKVEEQQSCGSRPRLVPQLLHTIELLLQAGQDYDTIYVNDWLKTQQKLPFEKRKNITIREAWPNTSIKTLQFSSKKCSFGFYESKSLMKDYLKKWNWR